MPKFVSKPNETIAVIDQPIKLECLVEALPKAKLSWILNGKELTAKDGVKFETDPARTAYYSMTISKVGAVHMGSYTIKASNAVGEVEQTFNLNVLGKFFIDFVYILNKFK